MRIMSADSCRMNSAMVSPLRRKTRLVLHIAKPPSVLAECDQGRMITLMQPSSLSRNIL